MTLSLRPYRKADSPISKSQNSPVPPGSRSRITAILNRNTRDVSTDLMLRVMAGLGYRATLTFSPEA